MKRNRTPLPAPIRDWPPVGPPSPYQPGDPHVFRKPKPLTQSQKVRLAIKKLRPK